MQNSMNRNRKILIVTLVIFILPVLISTTMYMTGWRPSRTVNHGSLISPAKLLEDRELHAQDGKPVKIAALRGKWTMFYFDTASCPDDCMKQLYFMRQTHLSMGKNYDRIQRVFVLMDDKDIATLKTRLSEYPKLQVLSADQATLKSMAQEFGLGAERNDRDIYLADPQGFLMMKYAQGSDPAGTRKDLERLLKYSGDNQ
jgi:cytochrome oxidase Cu insertion factor (SCO1/SenC/PrrC family)